MIKVGDVIAFEDEYFEEVSKNIHYEDIFLNRIVKVKSLRKEGDCCYVTIFAKGALRGWVLESRFFRSVTEKERKEYELKSIFIK